MIIYSITNTMNGKVYIGQTIAKTPTRRWKEHVYHLDHGTHHNEILQRAWNKYGEDAFQFEVITTCSCLDQLNIEERMYIELHNATNVDFGYNLHVGGRNGPLLEQTKNKISQAHKGKPKSALARKNMSAAQKGRTFSDEAKQKMSIARKGRPSPRKGVSWTPEQRQRISEATRLRMQEMKNAGIKFGRHTFSDEERRMRSEQMKGNTLRKDSKNKELSYGT